MFFSFLSLTYKLQRQNTPALFYAALLLSFSEPLCDTCLAVEYGLALTTCAASVQVLSEFFRYEVPVYRTKREDLVC